MSTSRGTWRRPLRSSSAVLLVAALVVTACGAAEKPSSQDDRAGLVFSRVKGYESSVWVANRDGSDARTVATGSVESVSPDGRFVAYVDPNDEEQRLFLLDLVAGKTRDLGPTAPLAWSPDGRTLATSNRRWLALVDAESGASRKVAQREVNCASFSPDGKTIAVSEGHALEGDLLVLRLSDGHVSELATGGDHPVWGTSWIAFNRWGIDDELGKDYGGVSSLYLIRPDGSGLRQLTIDEETVGQGKDEYLRFGLVPVAFSADGKRVLAEIVLELGPSELVAFDVPSGDGTKLTDAEDEGAIWTADLSADGTQILFEDGGLDDEANHMIFTMPFEGGKRRMLIPNATQASWVRGMPSKSEDTD
jgi:Tol biopolymer transport system component